MVYKIIFSILIFIFFSCSNDNKFLYFQIKSNQSPIMKQPNETSEILDKMEKGKIVIVKSDLINKKWFEIENKNLKHGYINKELLEIPIYYEIKDSNDIYQVIFKQLYNKYQNYLELSRNIENIQINKYLILVNRKNYDLRLLLDSTDFKTFTSIENTDDTKVKIYTFRDYIKEINCYLLTIHFYEGGHFILVNKSTGETIDIFTDNIVVSPDNKRIALVSEGEVYIPNLIQIYNVSMNSFIKEYDQEADYFPTNPIWINNESLIFTENIQVETKNGFKYIYDKRKLVFYNNKWVF